MPKGYPFALFSFALSLPSAGGCGQVPSRFGRPFSRFTPSRQRALGSMNMLNMRRPAVDQLLEAVAIPTPHASLRCAAIPFQHAPFRGTCRAPFQPGTSMSPRTCPVSRVYTQCISWLGVGCRVRVWNVALHSGVPPSSLPLCPYFRRRQLVIRRLSRPPASDLLRTFRGSGSNRSM